MSDIKIFERIKDGHLVRRFTALSIDFLILSLYAGALFSLSTIVSPLFQKSAVQSEISGLMMLVIPVVLYFSIFEASRFKATPGKLLLHLRVAKIDETDFNYKSSLIRSVVKFIPWEIAHFAVWQVVFPNSSFSYAAEPLLVIANVLLLLYFVFPFFDEKARAIHDYAAHTILIFEPLAKYHSQ